jgi:AAHS family 4-hydroxybenzoate transporter-like MFS transporter
VRELSGTEKTVDVQAFIDSQRFSRFHYLLFVLCFLIIAMDGLDTGAMGYIAPTLVRDWHVSKQSLGPMLSATLVGIGFGAIVVSPFADRIGRRVMLIGAVLLFGGFSFAGAFANSLDSLTALRFLTGIGLGAAVPNAVTLMAEYAPARIRSTVVNAMLVGFAAGNAVGGLLTAWLIPLYGWRSVLFVGGLAPLVLALVLLLLLPDSVKFLVVNGRPRERVAGILKRLSPEARVDNCTFVCNEEMPSSAGKKFPALELLSKPYVFGTAMLWMSYFMCLVVLYVVTNWMPTLFTSSGFSLHKSAVTSSLFHFGGCVGILLAGWLMDRFTPIRVVAFFFFMTAVMALLLGQSISHVTALTVLVVAMGVGLSGASASMSPLAAHYYPTSSRVTGVAWMLGMGRFGAVAGTFSGAMLLAANWTFGSIFSLLAVPSVIAAFALLMLGRNQVRAVRAGAARAASMTSPTTSAGR